jgi:predicted nucleic acid-binding protein
MSEQQVHVPHLIDSEVASGLSRRVAAQQISGGDGWAALDVWRRLAVTRYAVTPVLDRIWELRDNVSAHDAGYIALAERLGCAVVTADARLSRAPGIRCPVMVVPR